MRAGGQTRGSNVSDYLALFHMAPHPGGRCKFLHVEILSGVSVIMLYLYIVTVTFGIAGLGDNTVAHRQNRRSIWRCIIRAIMRASSF
jgi:hypothetical protein